MNKVILYFEKTLTNLAGYEFGIEIYEEQVKGKIDTNKEFFIEFPKQIKVVASSFVQGFFEEIVNEIGLLATEERAIIVSENDKIVKTLIKKLQWGE